MKNIVYNQYKTIGSKLHSDSQSYIVMQIAGLAVQCLQKFCALQNCRKMVEIFSWKKEQKIAYTKYLKEIYYITGIQLMVFFF